MGALSGAFWALNEFLPSFGVLARSGKAGTGGLYDFSLPERRCLRSLLKTWRGLLRLNAAVLRQQYHGLVWKYTVCVAMKQAIVHVALVVRDYDEAIEFYTRKLHFTLVEDTYQPEQDKRWVVVAPPGSTGTTLLLARASNAEQEAFIGKQTGGRVFLFLHTDNFWRDYHEMVSLGITFVREPKVAPYGTVAVFEDYTQGNLNRINAGLW